MILVSCYDEFGKKNIEKHPVIAIELRGRHIPFDSGLKLRKFVGYVGDDNWNGYYDTYRSRFKETVSRDDFAASCAKSYNKNRFPLGNAKDGVLSETYDVDSRTYHYSVHSTNFVYGKVAFVSGSH